MSGGASKGQEKKDPRSNAQFLEGLGLPNQEEAKQELNEDEMSKLENSARVFGLERFLHGHKLADSLPDGTSVFAFVLSERSRYKKVKFLKILAEPSLEGDEFLKIMAEPLLEDVKAYFRVMVQHKSIAKFKESISPDVFKKIQLMLWEDVDRQHLAWKCPCPEDSCKCEV